MHNQKKLPAARFYIREEEWQSERGREISCQENHSSVVEKNDRLIDKLLELNNPLPFLNYNKCFLLVQKMCNGTFQGFVSSTSSNGFFYNCVLRSFLT